MTSEPIQTMKTLICSSIVLAAFEGNGMLSARGMAKPAELAIGSDELNTGKFEGLFSERPIDTTANKKLVKPSYSRQSKKHLVTKHKNHHRHHIQQPRTRKTQVYKASNN
eukprot:TRINITY_DN4135_c0_g4_i1.p1 TRINITY_DN4135_c0_g4~~TRINITY_DN4135_c0_g4_i1.p1  ORF type:complete len:110 (+),score=16.88 TRINITY_DN4135_c0_g4_i1:63-392(+)